MSDPESSYPRFSLSREGLLPQEEMLEVSQKKKKMIIGIPREAREYESRVALTPEAVGQLVENGHEVVIESGAGKGAFYEDTDYSELGGYIEEKKETVFRSDIILKIAPLTFGEVEMTRDKQLVISSLHMNDQTEQLIRKMMAGKVTAIAYENIKDEHGIYPVVRSMSAIAGNTSILIAGEYLSNSRGGKGVMLGGLAGITPAEVVILGAGTAAEFAVRAAIGLGAEIKVFDSSVHRLRRLETNVGQRLYTSVFHPRVLEKALRSADVLIGALYLIEKAPRYLVTEDMVKGMKNGSLIIDISIDQGGCIETSEYRTHKDPVYVRHGVFHYCVPNIPSRVSRTASIAVSNVLAPLLLDMGSAGSIQQFLKANAGVRNGVYIFSGSLTNSFIGSHFGIASKDINLLMAAF